MVLAASTSLGCSPSAEEDGAGSDESAVTDGVVNGVGAELAGASDVRVLTRNEDALAEKIAIVDAAKAGETLDVSYYIFSDDESSAFYATRLIAAAKRGVKVRLMLDYLTNFARYNYFKAIQAEAGGGEKMSIRFYNKPTNNIVEDAKFLVTPCGLEGKAITAPECTDNRRATAKTSPTSAAKASLFLSGLYSKNGAALQASMGEVLAQYQAVQQQAASGATSAEDKQQALEGLKLVFDAKVRNDIGAMLLVFLAGDKLAPIHQLWAALVPQAANEHAGDWQHLTDFNHQKLTLRTGPDGKGEIVLGGRNIENSYHLTDLPSEDAAAGAWKKKYVFMDVDFKGSFTDAGKIRVRFEKVWNLGGMVAEMGKDLEKLTPPDLKVPTFKDGAVVGEEALLKSYTMDDINKAADRFTKAYASWDANTKQFTMKHRSKAIALAEGGQFPRMDVVDEGARYYYLDNLHAPNGRDRIFGMNIPFGKELENGKQIQELWTRALADLCKNGLGKDRDGKIQKAEITFHNAYVSFPGRLQYELFERARLRTNGTRFECENGVSKVRVLTNSRESTDLNIVNVYNDAWMKPIMDHDRSVGEGGYFLDYREYNTHQITEKNPISRSLHAKVMIFGNDVFIGSANADGRSAFMDANNGVFIRNAPRLAKAYRDWLASEIEPNLVGSTEDPRGLRTKSVADLAKENGDFLGAGLTAKGHPTLVPIVKTRITNDSQYIYDTAVRCFKDYDKRCIANLDQLLQPL